MPKIEMSHGCAKGENPLTPIPCKILEIVEETPDVKSFKVQTLDGAKPFAVLPGQTGMFSDIFTGESMFCVSGQGEDWVEFTVKRVGEVTEQLHALEPGDQCTVRGPYGNWWPYESSKGANMLFIAGGIGLPPVRAFLLYCLEHRDEYGRIDVVYSASTKSDLVFKEDLFENWPKIRDVHVHVSVYHGSDDWDGEVAYTAPFLESLDINSENRIAVLCGGPSLFRTCSESLGKMGFPDDQIVTTLEARMKCGVGKCGRCNVGGHYICLDGPVFTLEEVKEMKRDA